MFSKNFSFKLKYNFLDFVYFMGTLQSSREPNIRFTSILLLIQVLIVQYHYILQKTKC